MVAAVAVLGFAWVLSRRIAVMISGCCSWACLFLRVAERRVAM
jgi:hypothetical protein